MTPTLRPYQTRAIAEARKLIASGKRAPLLVSPAGSGKTTIGSAIVAGGVAKGKRVAWFAHRRELLTQAIQRLRSFDLDVGTGNSSKPVNVMSYQAACASGEVPDADIVVLDECHHVAAEEWKRVTDAYSGAIRIGLTATPERADGKGLGHAFDSLVTVAQYSELILDGHLVPCNVIGPDRELTAKEIIASPVDAYRSHGRGSCVVFAPHVKAAQEFEADFLSANISAATVHAKMSMDERDNILHKYARGDIRVLCNVAILTEGWDAPRTETIILARGVGSAGLYVQICCRASRPWGDKKHSILLDLAGVANKHGSPVEDRIYSLDGVGIRRANGAISFCRVCQQESAMCQCEGNGGELVSPSVVGDASMLKPWLAALRSADDGKKLASLRKLVIEAKTKGYKPGWVANKYKYMFGHWPSREMKERAG